MNKSSFSISLDTHNVLDYVAGFALIGGPYLFGFSDIYTARNTFMGLGALLIAYSLITRYRYSVLKIVPVGVHMAMDVILGIAVMGAPFLFSYDVLLTRFQYAIHFVYGLAAVGLVVLTRPKSKELIVSLEEGEDYEQAA
ncbi:MAG: hypothetical protein P4M08_02755 [Oligoflexia bacterium]|nr:hypothetical protein [Oligoflexia bacterium]